MPTESPSHWVSARGELSERLTKLTTLSHQSTRKSYHLPNSCFGKISCSVFVTNCRFILTVDICCYHVGIRDHPDLLADQMVKIIGPHFLAGWRGHSRGNRSLPFVSKANPSPIAIGPRSSSLARLGRPSQPQSHPGCSMVARCHHARFR